MAFLFFLAMVFATTEIYGASDYQITINDSQIKCKVDSKFLSIAFSIGNLNKTNTGYDFNSVKLQNLLKGLSPAYVRVGGTKANFLIFDPPPKKTEIILESRAYVPKPSENDIRRLMEKQSKVDPFHLMNIAEVLDKRKKREKLKGFHDFKMPANLFDKIYTLINSSGLNMVFDVNAFPTLPGNKIWNSTNAVELFIHVSKNKYNIDWELGNEPNHYKKFGPNRQRSGAEVGNDYNIFKTALKMSGLRNSKVIGPEITRPKKASNMWLRDFLRKTNSTIDALSWHQYYFDGRYATEKDFLNPAVLDEFVKQNIYMHDLVKETNFDKPVWITETGSAWGGGAKDLSDRFAAIFPYVDKLGVAGDYCNQVVARQAFLSGNYAMVRRDNYDPHPDYYAALLYKRLASQEILRVSTNKIDKEFRVYARCAKNGEASINGSLLVFILNLSKRHKTFSFADYKLFDVKEYLLQADGLESDTVRLNGKHLTMHAFQLPATKPKVVKQPVKIPKHSVGFYVLDTVNFKLCQG